MTAAGQLEVAGSGRSAPSSGHLNPHRNEGGKSAKPAAVLPPKVRNFRLTLTVVHHRRPSNRSSSLITLCRACHARLHRLGAIDRWVPELLSDLWAEQHPRSPRQLQLPADGFR